MPSAAAKTCHHCYSYCCYYCCGGGAAGFADGASRCPLLNRLELGQGASAKDPNVSTYTAFYSSVYSKTTAMTGTCNPGIFSDVVQRTHKKHPTIYNAAPAWR